MQTQNLSLWWLRLVTFALSALAGASALYWALKWPGSVAPLHSVVSQSASTPVDTSQIAQLLGAKPDLAGLGAGVVAEASKYQLLGVIAAARATSQQHQGSALIAVGSALAKPYRVGERVADDLILQSVHARSAALGSSLSGPSRVTLELAALSPARSAASAAPAAARSAPGADQPYRPPVRRQARPARDPND